MQFSDIPSCYSPEITASCVPKTIHGTLTGMATESTKTLLTEQMSTLRDLDPEALRRKYREMLGVDAATFGAKFLQRRIAHRYQEIAFGGLSDEEIATLSYIASHDPQVNPSVRSAPRSANDSRGVTYRREYHGRLYEMRSLGNGRYEYDAKIYTSPTAVVRAITGKSHYNGVVWWGLRKSEAGKCAGTEGEP